ncbi:hypothetical protein D3880_03835 [Pseudomonas cavernae]|uniref:Lipoprotein n=1 Tax=Pseudomonas cavernae TaxID=2320867 RepID=A0A385Z109_9PSED|nr:hypothetical protein [Pseudomonas cavernae]AYC31578.1 hypothetical protein D3880_03835 [Pseudomonas cavernae]
MLSLRALIVALMVALTGCATPDRAADLAPPIVISASTWRQVDSDIVAASQVTTGQAQSYAHGSMQSWMDLVYRRTDADFIPWFSGYWTQKWLSMKVAWYKLSAEGETDPTVNRLAIYLQEQYQDRVLEPVAKEIDPDVVMAQATQFYVQHLGARLQEIPQRYGVPPDQFDQRLKDIPAIALASPPAHSASLYQIVHADPLDRLPAYAALIDRIRNAPGGAGDWSADAGISSVAKQTSEKLVTELATSGVASAVSAVLPRVAGMFISLGVAGFSAIAGENERSQTEAQFRQSLNAAFDEEWLELMRNPATGVLAGVYHLSGQIEGSLADSATLPLKFEPLPREAPVPGGQLLKEGRSVYGGPTDGGNADQ